MRPPQQEAVTRIFYTPAFNLSLYGTTCNLSFYTAGAFRVTRPSEMSDTLFIAASVDCGKTWQNLSVLTGGAIGNNGLVNSPFTPQYNQWKEQSIPISGLLRNDPGSRHTFIRFRFKSGTDYPIATGVSFGTGNNFYLDRLTISEAPLGVKNGIIVDLGMTVAPNPTSGSAMVSLNGGDNSSAELNVTDVTGKLVYHTTVQRSSTVTKIEIPADAIAVKGMYLVKVITDGATDTQKLIVY